MIEPVKQWNAIQALTNHQPVKEVRQMADADSTRVIVTRANAKLLGLKQYFPGSQCKHGHIADRLVINGSCMECSRINRLNKYHANRDADLARQKAYRLSRPDHAAVRRKKVHDANPGMKFKLNQRADDHALRDLAVLAGLSFYESPRACSNCGTTKRFTNDGHCMECNRSSCRERFAKKAASNPERLARIAGKKILSEQRAQKKVAAHVVESRVRSARQTAMTTGALTYIGGECKNGHNGIRYTQHGSCVACASIASKSDEKKRYDAEYVKKNKERIVARSRKYHKANADKVMQSVKAWAANNPDRVNAIKKSYKARRRTTEKSGDSTKAIYQWEISAKKVCYWCGTVCDKKYHVDHYEPLSKGGKHEVANLVIACKKCNLHKSAKDPYEFAASLGRLF